jgi:hypothetical protein
MTRTSHKGSRRQDDACDAARQAVQEALDRRDNGGETGHRPAA